MKVVFLEVRNIIKNYSKYFNLQEVGQGIYAAIAVEGLGAMGNAGIIDMGNFTVIFDTFNIQQAAEDLKHAAEELTGNKIRYVINSHWHGDHVRGNQVFKDVDIIASGTTAELINTLQSERIKNQKAFLPNLYEDLKSMKGKLETETEKDAMERLEMDISFLTEIGKSLEALELCSPTITFDTRLVIYGTKRHIEILAMGTSHTKDDSIVYLPLERIAFMADVGSVNNHPMFEHGNPEKWVQVLKKVRKMDIDIIVPGHGNVGQATELDTVIKYIEKVMDITEDFINQGRCIEDINSIKIPKEFSNWKASQIFYQNIKFLSKMKI
jgi:glyoxylase-like metal-dependent hydrolase (beta-lactamase superfamily II)